ncbi:aromatic ring-hydroxylating dioxygenase subunit alpha [Dongia sp.]|uniref:aromatic ring-hydroxylating oxygenase subunit alpha n=1 Tax=Dongia sp. TaxID=1977262 RepID=UPI003750EDF2
MIQQKSLDWIEAAPERSLTLPARYFYDPKVFEAERERIFYPAWHCVAHVSELAEPGRFVTFDILDQSVIVSNHDGELHAFYNACQHRGNRLVNERRGQAGPVFRCGYHSWCYDRSGGLRNAPRTERLPDFDKKLYGLKPVKIEVMGCFVFINMDPDAAPLASISAGAEAKMAQYLPDLANMKLISEVDVVVPSNWKVIMDNSIEGYHFGLSGPVHKELAALIDFKQYALEAHDKWWTYIGPPKDNVASAYGVPLEGATWQTDWFFNIGIWPNTTFYCFPFADICGTFLMIPLEPEKSLLRFGYYGPAQREMPAVTRSCIEWMNQKLGPEDIELNVTNQRGLKSFGYNQGRYLIDAERSNESEHLVHHFHRLVHQAVKPALLAAQ